MKIFWIGVFLIPFDNLSFAPSMGWAAISPYFFLLFVLLNLPAAINVLMDSIGGASEFFLMALFYLAFSSGVSWFEYGIEREFFLSGLFKLILGGAFFCSLQIVISADKNFLQKIIKLLGVSYSIAIIFGVIQYINIIYPIGVYPIFNTIFARYYEDKVQFTFTEPSFASVHIFGVLIPIIFFARKLNISAGRLPVISLLIFILSVVSGSSVRVLFDAFFGLLIFFIFEAKKLNSKYTIRLLAVLFFAVLVLPENYTNRIESVVSSNKYNSADPSKEIRKFRSESAVIGIMDSNIKLFFGVGLFNSHLAMTNGYSEAFSGLSDVYPEIVLLKYKQDGLTYSMITKWISEFGFFGILVLLLSMINKRIIFLYACMIISYVQFDSYAFYSLWIYACFSIFVKNRGQVNVL